MNPILANLPLAAFWIVISGYLLGSVFIVYHLIRFGIDYKTKIVTLAFLAGLFALLSLNFYLFFKVDWTEFFDLINSLDYLKTL